MMIITFFACTRVSTRLRNMQTQIFSSLCPQFVKYCKGKAQTPSFLYPIFCFENERTGKQKILSCKRNLDTREAFDFPKLYVVVISVLNAYLTNVICWTFTVVGNETDTRHNSLLNAEYLFVKVVQVPEDRTSALCNLHTTGICYCTQTYN